LLVSWATCDAEVADSAPSPPTVNSNSVVIYGPAPRRHTQAVVGIATSYVYDYGKVKQASYASPLLHHVLLTGLSPGSTYYYTLGVRVSLAAGAAVGPGPKEYSFRVSGAAAGAVVATLQQALLARMAGCCLAADNAAAELARGNS
jgi:hypothetical protein